MDEIHPDSELAAHVAMIRWSVAGGAEQSRDELSVEEPLEIRVRSKGISVTMRTPGHDDELAAGFLLSEGLIQKREDISRIDPCVRAVDGNIINVFVAPAIEIDFEKLTRHVFASSSCGLCGKASIDTVRIQFPSVESRITIPIQDLLELPNVMRRSQMTFNRTGGLHAAALFDTTGKMLVLREDVGRHNAVDKVLGWALLNGHLPLKNNVLVVSGRSSFEIVQKALAGQIPIIASVSAPSSLAVELAHDGGQTLVGFLRENRANIYTYPERIVMEDAPLPS